MEKDTSEQCVIMAVINCTKIELPVKCDIKLYRNTFQTLFEHWFILIKRNKRNIWSMFKMETFSAILAICAGNSPVPVPGEFPTQRPVTRSFDVYFDLRSNKWLSKQSRGW